MEKIVVIGHGGHGKVVQDILQATGVYEIIAILDDKYENVWEDDGLVRGPVSYRKNLIEKVNPAFVVAIGVNSVRRTLVKKLSDNGARFATLIHPFSSVSPSAKIGIGTVIMPGVIINANAVIGDYVIVNSGAIVEHDNWVHDYSHISPGAVLAGNVTVGEGAHIGAGAKVIPGKAVGNWSVIGAGAVVIQDIPPGQTAIGVPAETI